MAPLVSISVWVR